MEHNTRLKLFEMLHSVDKELNTLGLSLLEKEITDFKEYKFLRGFSYKGKPFFPWNLRKERNIIGLNLRRKANINNQSKNTKTK